MLQGSYVVSDAADITDDQLIALAGEPAFRRGLNYFRDGRVLNLTCKGATIRAQAQGTRLYHVTLKHGAQHFEGSCDCPASEGFDFCKHCVAVALQYRQQQTQHKQLAEGDMQQRIQAYIGKLDNQTLRKQLLETVLRDSDLQQQWSIKADIALDKMDARAIRKRITAAIPYNRHLHRYPQVRSYFNRVMPVVDLLEQQLGALDGKTALKLIDYAMRRLARALETVDDSGGFRLDTEARLQQMHYQVLTQLKWSKPKLVEYLLGIDASQHSDLYPDIPDGYAELLGEQGMVLIYEQYQKQWDELPKLTASADWEQRYRYTHLQYLLRQRAEQQNDHAAVIALLQKTAVDETGFLEICDLCIQQDDWEQAEYWLGKASNLEVPRYKRFSRDFRLQRTQVKLLVHQSKFEQALELQWTVFTGSLSVADYQTLLGIAADSNNPVDYAQKAKDYLHGMLDDEKNHAIRFDSLTHYTDALARLQLHDSELDAAVELALQRRMDTSLLQKIAQSVLTQPERAIPLYQRLAEQLVPRGTNPAYQQAVDLLTEVAGVCKQPEHQRLLLDMLDRLRVQFKAKRNFIGYLEDAGLV